MPDDTMPDDTMPDDTMPDTGSPEAALRPEVVDASMLTPAEVDGDAAMDAEGTTESIEQPAKLLRIGSMV